MKEVFSDEVEPVETGKGNFKDDEILTTFLNSAFDDCSDLEDYGRSCYSHSFGFPEEENKKYSFSHSIKQEPNGVTPRAQNARLFCTDLNLQQTIGFKRGYEDLTSKPLDGQTEESVKQQCLSTIGQNGKHNDCSPMLKAMIAADKTQRTTNSLPRGFYIRKRPRWVEREVEELWHGIETHGNNWREIKDNFLSSRTYYQVKDKGRRVLADEGWISGSNDSTLEAKRIGNKIKKRFKKQKRAMGSLQ